MIMLVPWLVNSVICGLSGCLIGLYWQEIESAISRLRNPLMRDKTYLALLANVEKARRKHGRVREAQEVLTAYVNAKLRR